VRLQVLVPPLDLQLTRNDARWTFIIAAICGVTGVLVTYFFVPDMTGVDLAEEDAKFMAYLRENGWKGEVGEDDAKHLVSASQAEEPAYPSEKV
jgi:hypothetical protein